jgi:membrane protein YqaA with SNARE-associated domain
MIARLAQTLDIWGVILAAAAGSAIGESTAFLVGRSGKGIVQRSTMNDWIQKQMRHRWRAPIVLFALSAPPNPVFDVSGLLAGAFDVPLWLFLVAVFSGRIIRMTLVAFAGLSFAYI